jgi:predicted PurR-regulated permease PerM
MPDAPRSDAAGDRPRLERAAPPSAAAAETAFAAKLVVLGGLALVLLWFAYLARWGILIVYLSALIATGISPLAAWIERCEVPSLHVHPPRWLAALAVYLLALGVLVGMGSAVFPALIDQARGLIATAPSMIKNAESFLIRHGVMSHRMSMHELFQQIPTDVRTVLLEQFRNVIGGVVGMVLILILSLYLLHDAEHLRDMIVSCVPRPRRPQARAALRQIAAEIGAWMAGQFMLSAIIGSSSAIAFGIMGVPYFYVLAFVAAIGELIPYAGPVLAAVPAILLAFSLSWQLAVGTAAFCLVQQQVENHLLVPNLMQYQVGLTASLVIIAITIGSILLGVLGAIIAVPTAAILRVCLSVLRPDGG